MSPPPPPETIGPYRVVRELGRGGMGVVYEARREGLDRRIVLKLVLAEAASPESLLRFRREAELMARVRHPNVVSVHELLVTPRGPVLVCDLVEGEPLSARIRSGWRDDRAAARLVLQLADAVQALHQASIVHRDLKPDNVIVRPDGTPVLLDFGVARDQTAQRLTVTGAVLGTPHYMAPEQANGELPRDAGSAIGAATDVYGLGAILFELLAARPPFHDARSLQDCLFRVVTGAPLWPSATRPDVPRDLEAIVRRAMALRPADRHPSAGALRDDLARALEGLGTARPAGRRRAAAAAAVVGVVAAVAGGAALLRGGAGPPAPPAPPDPPRTPVRPPAPAPTDGAAPPAVPETGWRRLVQARRPDLPLPALLTTIPQRAGHASGPGVWSVGPEQIVTSGVGADGEPVTLVRSLGDPQRGAPVRHDLRLLPGALLAAAPADDARVSRALRALTLPTLAPGPRVELPVALRLDRPLVARAEPAGGALIAGVEEASELSIVVLRLQPDGAVQLLAREEPPDSATGVSLLLLGPGGRLVAGYRRPPSQDLAPSEQIERSVIVSRVVGPGAPPPERLELGDRATALALSDDGRLLCVGTSLGQVYVSAADRLAPLSEGLLDSRLPWDALCFRARGQPAPHAHTGWVTGAAFARDGALYTCSAERDLTVPSELRRWTLGSPLVASTSRLVERATPAGADGPTQLHALTLAAEGHLLLATTGLSTRREREAPPGGAGPCAVEVWLVAEPP